MGEQEDLKNAYNPSLMQTLGSNILLMTDPGTELHRLEITMRNIFINANGQYQKVGGDEWKPLINEQGMRRCLGLTESLVARNSIMSHIDEKTLGRLMTNSADVLIRELMQGKRYNIINDTARTTILNQCLNLIYMTLKRAENGGERRFLKGNQQEITYRTEQQAENKGLFSRLKGGG